jgi:hypothetical protein
VNNTHAKLLQCVTVEGVREHQAAFQEIADANGGTRASGTPGYDESAFYVAERLLSADYAVTLQPFLFDAFFQLGPSTLEQAAPVAAVYVENTDYELMSETDPGDVRAGGGHRGRPPTRARELLDQRLRGDGLCGIPGRQHRPDPAGHLRIPAQG